jgi:hypothetical protein
MLSRTPLWVIADFRITIVISNDIKINSSNSGYSNRILNTGHTYGTITDIMGVIMKQGEKGKHLNTLETYHAYKISKNNVHMNNTCALIHVTPYSKHYTNSTPGSSTHPPPFLKLAGPTTKTLKITTHTARITQQGATPTHHGRKLEYT